jgi:peptide/nickel transport system ATP-binding protein
MLQLAALSARYATPRGDVRAVSDIDLTIADNEIFGIAGESGCGKSSLLKVMYGNVRPPMRIAQGTVTIRSTQPDGRSIELQNDGIRAGWWKTISYVPQGAMSVLNPVAKIEAQFLDAVPAAQRRAKGEMRQQIIAYLDELSLPPQVLKSYPHQLSGGMRQRVVIAMATFLHPAIVLADEPTTALDVVVQRGILMLITRLQREMKNTLIIVSHDMGVHYQITHRMGIMYAGRVVERGPTTRIFERPLHPYTRALINALPKIGDNARREGIPGRPPALLGPLTGCPFVDRCPHAMDVCGAVAPAPREVEPGHMVECHLYS